MALSEDQAVTAGLGTLPPFRSDNSEDDRQALLSAIAAVKGPQRQALEFEYAHKYAGGPASAPASAMRDGFPESRGTAPPAPSPTAAPTAPRMSDDDALKAAFGGGPSSSPSAPPADDNDLLTRAFGPPPEGTFSRAARIAQDPDGGLLPAAGSVLSHVLGGDSAPSTSGGIAATTADMGRKLLTGTIGLGESAVGFANVASGGSLGSVLTQIGYDPKAATQMVEGYNSEAQQQSDANVGSAQGFGAKLVALAVNPRAVLGQVAEMVPSLMALGGTGGAFVRAAMPRAVAAAEAAGLTGDAATKFVSDYVTKAAQAGTAAALGAQTTGSVAEAGRQAGQDFSQYAPPALEAGLAAAGLAFGSKVAAQALGVGDVATDIATKGASRTAGGTLGAAGKEFAKGAAENAGFAGIQGAATNVATGQPWDANDLGGQVATGGAVGGLVSGLHGALAHGGAPAARPTDPVDAQTAESVASAQHPLQAAVDGYLGTTPAHEVTADIAQAPTVEAAIAAATAHSQSASALLAAAAEGASTARLQRGRLDAARAAIDALTAEPGEAPKVPEAPVAPAGRVDSSQYADLTPMDERTAQGRLSAMRGMQDSGSEGLNIVPHPDGTGRFAIGRVGTEPDATRAGAPVEVREKELPGPGPAAPAAEPPKGRQVVSALKLPGFERSAVENVRVQGAERANTPEDMALLAKGARQPFALTAAERVRYNDLKASETREDGAPAAPVAGRPQEIVRTAGPDLPRQSEAKAGELSQETHHVIVQMARMLGKKVVVSDLGKNDGQVSPLSDPNTIHLNRNSSKPHLVVFGHEVYHLMKAEHPEAAKVLADAMGLKDDANLDVPGIHGDHEEVQSDLHGNRFAEPQFWVDTFRKVLETDGAPATMHLGATITKVIRKMTRALGGIKGFDTDGMVKDLGAVRDAASTALSQYIRSRKGAAIEMDRADQAKKGTSEERVQSSDASVQKSETADRTETGAKFSEQRGKLEPDDLQTKATGKDGREYDVVLHKEMLGDKLHSVYVKAEDGRGVASMVDFNVRADGTLVAGTVKADRPGTGLSEALYRAARDAGYDIAPSGVRTDAGRGFTARLAEKGVINKPEVRASEKRNPDAIDVEGVHYSKQPRTVLSSGAAGSGMKGAERERGAESHRINFYVDKGQGVAPEDGVGGYAHKAKLTNLYDAGNDPRYLKEDSKDSNDFERSVVAKGYDGYYNPDFTTRQGAAVLLGRRDVPVEPAGQGARPPSGAGVPRTARTDAGYRATVAQMRAADLPAGELTPQRWSQTLRRVDPDLAAELAPTLARLGDEPLYRNDLIRAFKDDASGKEPDGTALLNVGLHVSDENGGGTLSPDEVKAALNDRGRVVYDHQIHDSETEPTMVARIDKPLEPDELHGLSKRLRQDAIAQRSADGSGALEGPKAEDWGGKYNPEFFRRMDGRTDTEHGTEQIRASARREELNPDVVATLGKHIRNLLPDERARLRRDTAQKLVDILSTLPSANEMAAVAYAGRAKRGWYAHSAAAMEHVFGADAPRFAALLAALSPQTGVETNLKNALNVWRGWVEGGRPSTREEIYDIMGKNVEGDKGDKSVLDAWRNNTVRALTREDGAPMKLSGPKVNSFFKNLIGHAEEVTNDTWMANFALVSQKIFAGTAALDALTGEKLGQKSPGYMAMSAQVRAAAKALTKFTGEEWTPAEVQETIWSWAKTLYERANVDESAVDLVKNKALTDELINSTPDFRTLFHADTNERILRDAGYGDRLDSLRSRSDLEFPGEQEPGAEGKAAPFADDAQQRYELSAARRLDALRARGREPVEDDVKASAAREEQEASPEFKKWFGDSKVVDAEGKPLVVYHGTSDAEGFDKGFSYDAKGAGSYGDADIGFFFGDKNAAGAFATDENAALLPSYLRLENPKIIPGAEYVRMLDNYTTHSWHKFKERAVAAGYDGVIVRSDDSSKESIYHHQFQSDNYIAFDPDQIKSAIGSNPETGALKYSTSRIVDDNKDRTYTPEQRAAFQKIGRQVDVPSFAERAAALRQDIGKKLQQGLVDQFAPIKDLTKDGYLLARLSKGAAGAFDAFLNHGKLSLKDGVYDADMSGGAIDRVFKPLGHESGDFLSWIAGNRAERLAADGRENLFSPADIAAYKSLDKGLTKNPYTLASGEVTRDRSKIYPDALRKYNEFNRNALDMAEQSGLIDKESRKVWENEMYVPFYRVAEERGGFLGNDIKRGLIRQQAFKQLKGGADKLNSDLLANTLQNWSHLIDAAAKNRAAKATLEAATNMGIATEADTHTIQSMGKAGGNAVWFLDDGAKRSFLIDPDHAPVLAALQALESVNSGPVMKALSTFKHWMTIGATASPAFKIRHLIRGSMTAMANADTGLNPIANAVQGFKSSSKTSQTYVSNLAGGGLFHFGTMLDGDTAKNVRMLVSHGVDHATILDSDDKIAAMMVKAKGALHATNDFLNRGEEMPRVALYDQLRAKGMSHAEAILEARDLLDYSLTGTWPAIRMIAQTVPFMNARAQGLYKLGRSAVENPARMATVLGALSLASVALMAANADDEDMKKRDDSDVDNFWAFKVGGTMYRIPKPFELGAAATLAERTVQAFTDPEMTEGRFLNIVGSTIGNQLNMNPIPQAVKPILDIYSNKDEFTGRPIETEGMQKLQSSERYKPGTSLVARGAGAVLQAGFDATGLTEAGHTALSPVQIDHLVGGWFGWLGSSAVTAADVLARPLTDVPVQPAPDYLKIATGQLAAEANDGGSRYVTEFYQQAKILQQVLGTYRALMQEGKGEEAAAFAASHAAELGAARGEAAVTASMARLNQQIKIIQNSTGLDAGEKRERILALRDQQSALAEQVTSAARGR